MKISASATVCALLTLAAFAADPPKRVTPAAPATPAPRPTKPVPDAAGKQDEARPPIVTLEGPRIAPTAPAPPLAPYNAAPGQPLPPNLLIAPREDTGPVITLNQDPAPLAPGIYTASPYTGIVVVPGPIDESAVKVAPDTRGKMPTVVPELKLTPKAK